MLSDAVPIPDSVCTGTSHEKRGWLYVTVLLFSDRPIPLLIPYIYNPAFKASGNESAKDTRRSEASSGDNDLKHWYFFNNSHVGIRHSVDDFE